MIDHRTDWFAHHGVEPGRFDGDRSRPLAGLIAEMLLDCAIRGEIERLDRLAKLGAVSDRWNEILKRRNWETYVRACYLIDHRPAPYCIFHNDDLFKASMKR